MKHTGTTGTLDWRRYAACIYEDPELFFPPPGGSGIPQTRQAKAVCNRCPVMEECRRWALDTQLRDGIAGGLTPGEREAILHADSPVTLHVPVRVPRARFDEVEIAAAVSDTLAGDPIAGRERLNAAERQRLATVIARRVGNEEAARLLRITPNSLYTYTHRDRLRTQALTQGEVA